MNFKLLKFIKQGKTILDIEKVINATKYMKQHSEVRNIMLDIKQRIVNEMIEDYKHIDEKLKSKPDESTSKPDESMYSAENSSYEVEDGHIKEPEEDKTLEELSDEYNDKLIKSVNQLKQEKTVSKELIEDEEDIPEEEEIPEKFIEKPKNAYSKKKKKA